jgi:hypothetical protein
LSDAWVHNNWPCCAKPESRDRIPVFWFMGKSRDSSHSALCHTAPIFFDYALIDMIVKMSRKT